MKKLVMVAALFIGLVGFAQKKKDLIKQVAQLKAQNADIKGKLNAFEKAKEVNLENDLQRFSYADSLAYNAFSTALKDVMNGNEKIKVADANKQVKATLAKMEEARNKKLMVEGAQFLAKNAKRPEVKSTESGLQYEIVTAGNGAKPSADDKVKVHYTGMLIDGEVFDSSVARGEPIVFQVGGVIKGWQEALQLMPVGSKWKLYIPYDLAYGKKGAGGGLIPPFAVLIFDVDLLGIEQ